MVNSRPKTLVTIAGIPSSIEQDFVKKLPNLSEGIREIIFLPVSESQPYNSDYVRNLYQMFVEAVGKILPLDEANVDAPTWFDGAITVYFDYGGEKPAFLIDAFGVETFVVSVKLAENAKKRRTTPNSTQFMSNSAIRSLRKVIREAESILPAIRKEVTSNANKTPLLLPFSNFDKPEMIRLRNDVLNLFGIEDSFGGLRSLIQRFVLRNTAVKYKSDPYWSFASRRGIVFRRPSALHACNWNLGIGHQLSCVIRSRLRFGLCINPRFHYDCVKSKGSIPEKWNSCHGQEFTKEKGKNYVNISPNDYIR